MAQQATPPRQLKYHLTPSQQQAFNRVMYGVILVGIGVWIGSQWFAGDAGYATNLYTELLSIGVTVGILNFLAEQREERRRIRDLQERLVREAGSPDNATTLNAVRELDAHGWLVGDDGLLRGAHLWYANLRRAELWNANLEASDFNGANLGEVGMGGVNLRQAKMGTTNLSGAMLWRADLEDADLRSADLHRAYMGETKLGGADLWRANLEGVNFQGATFNEKTVLPDAKISLEDGIKNRTYLLGSYYQPSVTDMGKYTDPDHVDADGNPDFWRPEPGSVWWYPEEND